MDSLDQLTEVIFAIKSDPDLKEAFLKVLSVGSFTQQVRVAKLLEEVERLQPPSEVIDLLKLLQNDKIAGVVFEELSK